MEKAKKFRTPLYKSITFLEGKAIHEQIIPIRYYRRSRVMFH